MEKLEKPGGMEISKHQKMSESVSKSESESESESGESQEIERSESDKADQGEQPQPNFEQELTEEFLQPPDLQEGYDDPQDPMWTPDPESLGIHVEEEVEVINIGSEEETKETRISA
jgi:hypothetical protein